MASETGGSGVCLGPERTAPLAAMWALARAGAWKAVVGQLRELVAGTESPEGSHGVEAVALLAVGAAHTGERSLFEQAVEVLEHSEPQMASATRGFVLACCAKASWYAESGEAARGLELLENLGEDHLGNCDEWLLAFLEMVKGKCLLRSGDPDGALEFATAAAERARGEGFNALAADAYSLGAAAGLRERDHDLVQQLLAEASNLYLKAGDMDTAARVSLTRASHLAVRGLLETARPVFEQVAAWAAENGILSTLARATVSLGWAAAREGNVDGALETIARARSTLDEVGVPAEKAMALEYLMDAHLLGEDVAEARRALSDLRDRYQDVLQSRADLAVEVGLKEATLLLGEEKFREAVGVARKWLGQAQEEGLTWECGSLLRVLGAALVRLGEWKQAYEELERAERTFEDMGEVLEIEVVRAWKAALERAVPEKIGVPKERVPRRFGVEGGPDGAVRFWVEHEFLGPLAWLEERLGEEEARAFFVDAEKEAPSETHEAGRELNLRRGVAAARRHRRKWKPAELWWKMGFRTRSEKALEALYLAEQVAREEIPVLILGPSGCGKEILARGLHALSGRSGPFVAVNCASGRGEVFMADLRGVKKGAFTGATQDRVGYLEEAHEGTLFLDEIGDLGSDEQGYLLRFLDSGEVVRLGTAKSKHLDVRVIGATNRPIRDLVESGKFREDLFFRIAGVILELPGLEERAEDLDLLIRYLWVQEGGREEDVWAFVQPGVIEVLRSRKWRGNVRQLRHEVAQAVLWTKHHGVEAGVTRFLQVAGRMGTEKRDGYEGEVQESEFRHAWQVSGQSGTVAGMILGVTRPYTYRIKERFGVDGPEAATPPA